MLDTERLVLKKAPEHRLVLWRGASLQPPTLDHAVDGCACVPIVAEGDKILGCFGQKMAEDFHYDPRLQGHGSAIGHGLGDLKISEDRLALLGLDVLNKVFPCPVSEQRIDAPVHVPILLLDKLLKLADAPQILPIHQHQRPCRMHAQVLLLLPSEACRRLFDLDLEVGLEHQLSLALERLLCLGEVLDRYGDLGGERVEHLSEALNVHCRPPDVVVVERLLNRVPFHRNDAFNDPSVDHGAQGGGLGHIMLEAHSLKGRESKRHHPHYLLPVANLAAEGLAAPRVELCVLLDDSLLPIVVGGCKGDSQDKHGRAPHAALPAVAKLEVDLVRLVRHRVGHDPRRRGGRCGGVLLGSGGRGEIADDSLDIAVWD
mmetsp:Transcript_23106/g.56960  ORF Transcript_23106/g.56960 Transcript_23106/m.56960 type:complete len:373 (+) Transcript_23106:289-1407(+)